MLAYIKEHGVSVGISVVSINAVESLGKLDVAELLSELRVHEKTHGFSHGLAVVDVVVAIEIQHERRVRKHSRDPNLYTYNKEFMGEIINQS